MNKKELIIEVSKRIGLSELFVGATIDATFDIIKETIEKKETMILQGVGKLDFVKNKSRVARNPKTNEQIYLPETYRLKFIPTVEIRNKFRAKPISKKEYEQLKLNETY